MLLPWVPQVSVFETWVLGLPFSVCVSASKTWLLEFQREDIPPSLNRDSRKPIHKEVHP